MTMKIYSVGPLDEGDEFFATKREAILRAKDYDIEDGYVIEHETGKMTKQLACRLASGRQWCVSQKEVWRKGEPPEPVRKQQTFSIFGDVEAAVAEAMIAEGLCTKIPLADIPMSARYSRFPDGRDVEARFAMRIPSTLVRVFEQRVLDLRA